jgi:hypothetical protein
MSRCRLFALWTFLALLLLPGFAFAQELLIDGSVAGPATCPNGGTAVNALCEISPTPAANRGCRYGGEVELDDVTLQNGAVLCVAPFDGADKESTGNLVLKSRGSILIDETSRITAKGSGYQPVLCDDGPGPTAQAGGRGGCGVRDSAGGGAHFGMGGRGTRDIPAGNPLIFEEDCGGGPNAGNTDCTEVTDCRNGDALPTVAGLPFTHSLYVSEFGAAGGDKGCRDGDGFTNDAPASHGIATGGGGGGRIVLFAANAAEDGLIRIAGRVSSDGERGCGAGNDSAGGGAGGTIFIVGDMVDIRPTARVSAHGGRGGDSQPKCLPCTTNADCNSNAYPSGNTVATGQLCVDGMCNPCNCTPCSNDGQCDANLGQTCRALANMPTPVAPATGYCANTDLECTPFDPEDDEKECRGTQNTGTCDDCAGGGGGGIVNVQSRVADIDPAAIFDVRGALGGVCPVCAGEAGGGAGELQIDSAYVGEVCDGFDNDFDGDVDEDLGTITCPNGDIIDACVGGLPQPCVYDDEAIEACEVPATDARPRFSLIVDTSGSMLNDLAGVPTFGDGSEDFPGVDTASDADLIDGNNSRLFIAKDALRQVLSSFPESDYALGRYYQDVGINRSCQTASNFECASSCCSYDDPRDNLAPVYPDTYPGNYCILNEVYPGAGFPADPAFTGNISLDWEPEGLENPPTSACINYAGSCGPPRRGAQYVVGFNEPITRYLSWLDGAEDSDGQFDASTDEGNHCADGDCELRGTGPTPLANALQSTYDFLTPTIACDGARECRSYTTILLTDGAESCEGDPATAAAQLFAGVSGKVVRTYVIGFSVLPTEEASLNAIAVAGGTAAAIFVSDKEELADALAQIIGQDQRFELCNDDDDDCDGLVDEDFPEKGEPCSDGELGVCAGTGTFQCTADFLGTECVLDDPGQAPGEEICNGLDDDCDGFIDEDENNQPLDCSTCVISPEICDGIDNDCDLAIDEEEDVFANQPDEFGIECEPLVPPNDEEPCRAGIVRCINAEALCLGFIKPGEEICNGQDDDCDGVGDNEAQCPGETQCVEGQCVFECQAGEFPCPAGYDCRAGFCFQASCDDVECPDGQACVAGLCVDEEPSGQGGGGGEGGGAGQGGGVAPQGTGVGGGAQTGSGATGPASATGATSGAGGPTGDNFGLVTGGGGLKCATAVAGTDAPGRGAIAALLALGLALVSRRARGGR